MGKRKGKGDDRCKGNKGNDERNAVDAVAPSPDPSWRRGGQHGKQWVGHEQEQREYQPGECGSILKLPLLASSQMSKEAA